MGVSMPISFSSSYRCSFQGQEQENLRISPLSST